MNDLLQRMTVSSCIYYIVLCMSYLIGCNSVPAVTNEQDSDLTREARAMVNQMDREIESLRDARDQYVVYLDDPRFSFNARDKGIAVFVLGIRRGAVWPLIDIGLCGERELIADVREAIEWNGVKLASEFIEVVTLPHSDAVELRVPNAVHGGLPERHYRGTVKLPEAQGYAAITCWPLPSAVRMDRALYRIRLKQKGWKTIEDSAATFWINTSVDRGIAECSVDYLWHELQMSDRGLMYPEDAERAIESLELNRQLALDTIRENNR